MVEHVTEWLNAYMDGELRGSRLRQVKQHLTECQTCRAELESLQKLSTLLHEVPAPALSSADKFTAQVNLRLPRTLPKATKRKVQEVGWWMIPVTLLLLWVFIGTTALVRDVLSTASEAGLLKNIPAWLVDGTSTGSYWSSTLGEIGMLGGESLKWAAETESFTRNTVLPFIWQASIALLYIGWIVIWWARYKRQGHGQPLKS